MFHFEGKIWRTVPMLAWCPGTLTREYIDGRRASYVSPIALFLFSLFLMFAVVKQLGLDFSKVADVSVNDKHVRGLDANLAELARLERRRAGMVAQHRPTEAIDGEITGRKQGTAAIKGLRDPTNAAVDGTGQPWIQSDLPALNEIFSKAKSNPQLAIFKLQSNAYKFAWLLIPISVPFLWLLFPFSRRFGIYDHTDFVTYSLSFMMLLMGVATIGAAAGIVGAAGAIVLIAPWHIYRQVRHSYGLTRFGAIWRTLAIGTFAFVALSVFGLVLAGLGAVE